MENETKFNLSQAAVLAGTSRQRISRFIKQGRLSAEKTADGKTVIDKSELLRVFPNLVTPETLRPQQTDSPIITSIIEVLQRELDVTRQERDSEKRAREEERDRLLKIIESQQTLIESQQTLLLPAPKEPEPKKTFWQRLFSS
jgi:hypothetical protein